MRGNVQFDSRSHINLRVADLVDGGTKSPSVYGHSNCLQF